MTREDSRAVSAVGSFLPAIVMACAKGTETMALGKYHSNSDDNATTITTLTRIAVNGKASPSTVRVASEIPAAINPSRSPPLSEAASCLSGTLRVAATATEIDSARNRNIANTIQASADTEIGMTAHSVMANTPSVSH